MGDLGLVLEIEPTDMTQRGDKGLASPWWSHEGSSEREEALGGCLEEGRGITENNWEGQQVLKCFLIRIRLLTLSPSRIRSPKTPSRAVLPTRHKWATRVTHSCFHLQCTLYAEHASVQTAHINYHPDLFHMWVCTHGHTEKKATLDDRISDIFVFFPFFHIPNFLQWVSLTFRSLWKKF